MATLTIEQEVRSDSILNDEKTIEAIRDHLLSLAPILLAARIDRSSSEGISLNNPPDFLNVMIGFSAEFVGDFWHLQILGSFLKHPDKHLWTSSSKLPLSSKTLSWIFLDAPDKRKNFQLLSKKKLERLLAARGGRLISNVERESIGEEYSRGTWRYGIPILRDDTIISKAAMVTLMLEIRSGILDGWRWYWDFAPEVGQPSSIDSSSQDRLTWSRAAIGYAIKLELPRAVSAIAQIIEITPKIGLLDFDLNLPLKSPIGITRATKFRSKNVTDFGAEVSLLGYTKWLDYRLYSSGNTASSILSLTGSTVNVLGFSMGMEAYLFTISLWNFQTQLALFGAVNQMTIEDTEIISNADLIKKVSYAQAFGGFGSSLSW